MQFVKEATHSKRTQKMKNKEKQRERNAIDKALRESKQTVVDEGILHPEAVIKDNEKKINDNKINAGG